MDLEELAISELGTARTDLARARNRLGIAMVLFALMHVLIIGPFTRNQNELDRLQVARTEIVTLSDLAETQAERIENVSEFVSSRISVLLSDRTAALVADFDKLADTIRHAMDGDWLPRGERPVVQPQLQLQQVQRLTVQDDEARINAPPDQLVQDFVESAPGARDEMLEWARENLVLPTYASIQEEWENSIRSELLDKLNDAISNAQGMATKVGAFDPVRSEELNETARTLTAWRDRITELDLTPDANAALPVDADFWRTEAGKEQYADLLNEDVQARLSDLNWFASRMPDTLLAAAKAQDDLVARLDEKQKELSQQFDKQKGQVESLIGGWAILPLALPEFVAYFPISMGLVFGFILLQAAVLRRNAADIVEDLNVVWNGDRTSLRWLTNRMQPRPHNEYVITALLAVGAVVWIVTAEIHTKTGKFLDYEGIKLVNILPTIPVILAAVFEWASTKRLAAAILKVRTASN